MASPFRVLFPSMRKHRRDLTVALCAGLGAQAASVPLPLLARWLVNRVGKLQPTAGAASGAIGQVLWTAAALFAAMMLLRGVLRWHQAMRGERAAQGVLADVRDRMYQHLQRLSQGYFDRRPIGKTLVRFVGDANALRTWIARTVITVPGDILLLLGVVVSLGVLQWQLLLAAAPPLVLLAPILAFINPRARRWTREGRHRQALVGAELAERLPRMGVIKAANAQGADGNEVREMIESVAAAYVRRGRLDAWTQAVSSVATTAALSGVVLVGVWLHLGGRLTHGDLLAAIWMTLLIRGPVERLSRANVVHQRARVAAERIAALLNREPEPGWSDEVLSYTGPGRSIKLSNVGYRDATRAWVFRGLNVTIEGPGLVAVTEGSPVARTMFLELLLRLRRPHQGQILMDGHDVRKLRVGDLRRQIGWVDRERRVLELNRELDTQQPAYALLHAAMTRAMATEPALLLLDDPTADLDAEGVERLIGWLQTAARDRLVILATIDPRVVRASKQVIQLPCPGSERRREDAIHEPMQTVGAGGTDGRSEACPGEGTR